MNLSCVKLEVNSGSYLCFKYIYKRILCRVSFRQSGVQLFRSQLTQVNNADCNRPTLQLGFRTESEDESGNGVTYL